MKLLSLDPGIRWFGFAVLEVKANTLSCLTAGIINASHIKYNTTDRIVKIFTKLESLVEEHTPVVIASEDLFLKCARNIKPMKVLSMLAGIIHLLSGLYGVTLYTYTVSRLRSLAFGVATCDKADAREYIIKMGLISEDYFIKRSGNPIYDITDAIAVGLACFEDRNIEIKHVKRFKESQYIF